jgi:hypothetical protein
MPTAWLFVIDDPQGRRVGLREATLRDHILPFHPGVTADWIRETIERPRWIVANETHGSLNYVGQLRARFFRLVAAKPNQGDPQWVVATAYPTAVPPRGGRILWTRPTTP